MWHLQHALEFLHLYSSLDLEGYIQEQLEVIWQLDAQTVLHMQIPQDSKVCGAFALQGPFACDGRAG